MKRLGWILAVAVTVAASTSAQACMKDGEEGEAAGRLSIANASDAAGRPQRPYIVTLSAPACLASTAPENRVESTRTLHIFSADEKVHAAIAGFVGKSVRVRGTPFAAHTAHHHAPIVMDIVEIRPQ